MMQRKTKAQEWAELQVASNPPATATPLDILGKVLALAEDPKSKAAKQFLADIASAHAAAAKATLAELARLKAAHDEEVFAHSQAHTEAVAKDRAQLAKDRIEFGKERDKAWAEIEAARKAATADREAAAALKADWERRLQRMRQDATETA